MSIDRNKQSRSRVRRQHTVVDGPSIVGHLFNSRHPETEQTAAASSPSLELVCHGFNSQIRLSFKNVGPNKDVRPQRRSSSKTDRNIGTIIRSIITIDCATSLQDERKRRQKQWSQRSRRTRSRMRPALHWLGQLNEEGPLCQSWNLRI
jgi:hypothetical protein